MAALGVRIHKDRCSGIVLDLCASSNTSLLQSFFCVIDNEFFTKGIDEMLGATCDDELIRILLSELHGIANLITPETTAGADDHCVVHTWLHFPKRQNASVRLSELFHRNELIEDIVIYHQHHGRIVEVGLDAKEAFRSIIRFHVMHVGQTDDILVLLTIGSKGYASVEEHFEVGPDFVNGLLA